VLYHGDCLELVELIPETARKDLGVVTDPPYGIGEAAGKNKSRSCLAVSKDYGVATWDNKTIPQEGIDKLVTSGEWSIVFGGNYYYFPPSSCWLVWDKMNGKSDFADCELAWTNLKKAVRKIEFLWNGMLRGEKGARVHPTQKPVTVMKWCIEHLPDNCQTIFDPFTGSGTTGVAAVRLGRKFIGIEIEEKYCEIAAQRISEECKQIRMDFEKR